MGNGTVSLKSRKKFEKKKNCKGGGEEKKYKP